MWAGSSESFQESYLEEKKKEQREWWRDKGREGNREKRKKGEREEVNCTVLETFCKYNCLTMFLKFYCSSKNRIKHF